MSYLEFGTLKEANKLRAESLYKQPIKQTPIADWCVALMGEAGELCNVIKKIRRIEMGLGDFNYKDGEKDMQVLKEQAGKELADLVIYADLIAQSLDIDLGNEVTDKFNEVSKRNNCDIILNPL